MALDRYFSFNAFPTGTNEFESLGFPNIAPSDLVLFCNTYDTVTNKEMPLTPLAIFSLADGIEDYFVCGCNFPDGSFVSFQFLGSNFNQPNARLTFDYTYSPTVLGLSMLSITSDAYKLLHEKMGYNTTVDIRSGETPLNGVLFESLNGADGSYADGTPVTVTGRDGAFKVLASRNFYNDSKDSQNMLIYLLERTDLTHKPTMLVADIYVKKVVVP